MTWLDIVLEIAFLVKVYVLVREFSCLQENAQITQAHTNVLVILDTVDPIALLILMTVNLHLADMVGKILLSFLKRLVDNVEEVFKAEI